MNRFKMLTSLAVVVLAIVWLTFGVLRFLDFSISDLGQTGDFIGGVGNPLLTLLTFIGVLYTIKLQSDEIISSKDDAIKQSFETTFFQMLSLANSIASAVEAYAGFETINGRQAFRNHYKEMRQKIELRADIANGFSEFWRQNRQQLGHYYRYLYNIIRFIDESDFKEKRP